MVPSPPNSLLIPNLNAGQPGEGPRNLDREGSGTFEAFEVAVRALEESSAEFLPLKSAFEGLLAVVSTQQSALNEEDFGRLTEKIEDIKAALNQCQGETTTSPSRQRFDELGRAISQEVDSIPNCGGDISTSFRAIMSLFECFQCDTDKALSIHGTVNVVGHDQLNITTNYYVNPADGVFSHISLNNLSHVAKASYDASTPAQRRGCTDNTRTAILIKLQEWASDPSQPKIYWMKGMAGTGKTAIAYSLCLELERRNILGSTFFCTRLVDECSKVDRIFPTIAYDLARNYPPLAPAILEALKKDPDAAHRTLNQQFTNLIFNPITTSITELAGRIIIIIIDALDECGNQNDVQALLSVIFNRSHQLPFKIFITSRPEQAIRTEFNQCRPETYSKFILHDVEQDIVDADIKLYITERLVDMVEGRSDVDESRDDWPPKEEIDILTMQASGLFIFAKTVCDYIGERGGNISERLIEAASNKTNTQKQLASDKSATSALDGLYREILERAIPSQQRDYDRQKLVLSAVISIRNPLSACGLGALLNIDPMTIKSSLASLHSVISVPQSIHSAVSTFHASFPDFITESTRSQKHFLCSSKSHHQLSTSCLLLLNSFLKENICGLDGRPANDEIDEDTIAQHIPEGLGYACLFWATHLTTLSKSDIQDPDALFPLLHEFLREHVLHWLECLSLLHQLGAAVDSLRMLERWILGLHPEMLAMVVDARRFAIENFEIISHHCLETYHSALVWLPTQSFIRERWATQGRYLPHVVMGLRKSWGACENVIRSRAVVLSVALSRNGGRIVYGIGKTAEVCNSSTGDVEIVLKGHMCLINAVAISSDDSRIVSGSNDKTVRIWSAVTGESVFVLKGHSSYVTSVAFAGDGRTVVSGSFDKTVWVWNALAGKPAHVLTGHSRVVTSVACSSDGSRVASGSNDSTIRIWNVLTGESKCILTGDCVMSMAFSSDGSRFASGSFDNTIQICNTLTGKSERVLKGHSNWVHSVAFSSDGRRFASGSFDETIRIWDVLTGKSECVLMGHSNVVTSLSFSNEGNRIASGSIDNTIRIWDVLMDHSEDSDRVCSVGFLNDGGRVGSGPFDKLVRIWKMLMDQSNRVPAGHSDHVDSVAFSSDGCRIASGSRDKTVLIWNVSTGHLERVLKGHTDRVHSVTFSSDGSRVVSGSYDKTVRIWKTTTGKSEHVLTSRSMPVFLSDGSKIACGHRGQFVVSSAVQGHGMDRPTCSVNAKWIYSNTIRHCWIPPHYRPSSETTSWGSMISFGLTDGQVVVLDLNPPKP